MKVYNILINGRKNPMGINFSRLVCSWKVKGAIGKNQADVHVIVIMKSDFSTICYEKYGKNLLSMAEPLDIELMPRTRYYWKVIVKTDAGESGTSETAFFETGKMQEEWYGKWITMQAEDIYHPEFKKEFQLMEGWKKAALYISGLGVFEAYLNHEKIGEDYLAPFTGDYRDGVQYCTYDITKLVSAQNTFSVLLGDGWFKGHLGYTGLKEVFGSQFYLIAEIHVEYEDGKEIIIGTDDTWEYHGSDIMWSDIYNGESVDELYWEERDNPWKNAVAAAGYHLIDRESLPLTGQENILAKHVLYTPLGETVLDFGQNFAGFVVYQGSMKRDETLKLEFGEILQDGNFYRDNYRAAKAQFQYRSAGKTRLARPHFTYFGFRYVKVEGIGKINPEDFTGIALYSKLERTGQFQSSSKLLNALYENTVWGLKSNFVDMPTDCPQRDERLGWTGDAQVFSGTASYHMDTRAFYEKYLRDLRKDQEKNGGRVAMYLPNLQPGLSCALWGDAATIIPAVLFTHYGDQELLKEQYPLMKSWVDFITLEDEKRGRKNLWDFGFQLGDWLALDGVTEQSMTGATDVGFIASAYYYGSVKKVAETARILAYEEDEKEYQKLADEIKDAIFYEYYTPSGKLAVDTQTAYYLALHFKLYRTKEGVIESLKRRLKRDCYEIKSGFAGAPLMCNVLAEADLIELAYDFLFNEEYPGWLFEVKMGATTVWERWNSVLPDGKISGNGMNSLNHYAYGAIAEFLYRYAAGIYPVSAGFKKVKIAPKLTRCLQWLDCSYESAAGRYRIRWEFLDDGDVSIHVEIPFDAAADIVLPDSDAVYQGMPAGCYDYRYKPKKDYRYLFDRNTRLKQLKGNKEAVEIAGRECMQLKRLLEQGDKEVLSQSLQELSESAFSGLPKEELGKAIDKITKIKSYSR